jgi:hypothetical protein
MEKLELFKKPADDELFEKEGHYPTEAALNYIKNWCSVWEPGETPTLKFGEYFGDQSKVQELLEFITKLWWYTDIGVEIKNDKIELHTLGWSGNEDIIRELKNSSLWLIHWRKTYAGGHYYFDLGREKEEFVYDNDAYTEAMHWFSLGVRAASENKTEEFTPKKVNFKTEK